MNVDITMKTTQFDKKKKIDTIIANYKGKIYEKKDGIYVVYKEESENEKITNTIKINEKVSIKKFGTTNSNMIFEKGKTNVARYMTTNGLFVIENTTNKLDIDVKENDIKITIDYDINIMDLFNGRNEISISIRK